MELMEFIKKMWKRMSPETKDKAVEACLIAMGLTSDPNFRQRYLGMETLPEEHHHTVAEIFHDALSAQNKEEAELLESVPI